MLQGLVLHLPEGGSDPVAFGIVRRLQHEETLESTRCR
jgi:hypothetical protein